MPQIHADSNFENYPFYIGWEVNRLPELCEPYELDEDALEQVLEPANVLKNESKSESTPPVLDSENPCL